MGVEDGMRAGAAGPPAALMWLGVFALTFLVYFLRRPDILTAAQFWAEDGSFWFAEAYNFGPLEALFLPHTAYLQTFPRLVFGALSGLPVVDVPLYANIVGLAVRAVVAAFLFSGRFPWIDGRVKGLLLLYFLLMPGLAEVHANITNTQWYLGLYLLLVVLADGRKSRAWKAHDYGVALIAGLSGPFVVVLAIARAVVALPGLRRDGWAWSRVLTPLNVLLAAFALLQGAVMALAWHQRALTALGADPLTGIYVFSGRVLAGTLFPFPVPRPAMGILLVLALLACAVGVGVLAGALLRCDWRVRTAVVFGMAVLALSMASPNLQPADHPQWHLLLLGGDRYFVIPRLMVVAAVLALGASLVPKMWRTRAAVAAAFAGTLICLPQALMPPVGDHGFRAQAIAFDTAPPGTVHSIAIAPPGWIMRLTKH